MNIKYHFSPILRFILVLFCSSGGLLRITCVRPVHIIPIDLKQLFLEQIAVSPSTRQSQNQSIVFAQLDQKPIRFNMAFSMPLLFPGQCVITVPLFKSLPIRQCRNHCIEFRNISASTERQLVVLLKATCENNLVDHFLSSASASDRE